MKYKIPIVCGSVLLIAGGLIAFNLGSVPSTYDGGVATSSAVNGVEQTEALDQPTLTQTGSPDELMVSHEVQSYEVDFEAIRKRLGVDYDPMIILGHDEFSDEEIDAYNDLHVIPFNKVVGIDCHKVVSPTLPNTFDEICQRQRERPEHPYSTLSDEDLELLGKNDAVAAVLMARRAKEPMERFDWYLRSTALSGKPGPLMTLAERRYSDMVIRTIDEDGNRVNLPDYPQLVSRFAIEQLASELGDPRAMPSKWESQLSTEQIEMGGKLVNYFRQQIEEVRLEVGHPPLSG